MSDERIAALRYFLDLDNPYLGVEQQRIMEGIAALKSLESQNQALQEALDKCSDRVGVDQAWAEDFRAQRDALQERIEEAASVLRGGYCMRLGHAPAKVALEILTRPHPGD